MRIIKIQFHIYHYYVIQKLYEYTYISHIFLDFLFLQLHFCSENLYKNTQTFE